MRSMVMILLAERYYDSGVMFVERQEPDRASPFPVSFPGRVLVWHEAMMKHGLSNQLAIR